MAEQFIGRGWQYPMAVNAGGGVALSDGDAKLEQAIRLVLGTAKGERPMRPEFGCGIHDYVFAPANITTAGKIAYEVKTSLARWEPRIDVRDVIITFDRVDRGCLYIEVQYSKKGGYDRRNLVFPFYVIPEEQ